MKFIVRYILPIQICLALSSQAAINVSINPSSTSTQLDLSLSGTLETSDFGSNFFTTDPYPFLLIFKGGLDWTNTAFNLSPQNFVDGSSLTAPKITAATGVSLLNQIFVNVVNGVSVQEDALQVNWDSGETVIEPEDFAVGQIVDWHFSVRNFGILAVNFDLLRVSEIPFSAQFGTGSVVPEPSTFALVAGILSLATVFLYKRRNRTSCLSSQTDK